MPYLVPLDAPSRGDGLAEFGAFLARLATDRNLATATENRALDAVVFLYGKVLQQSLGSLRAAGARGRAASGGAEP